MNINEFIGHIAAQFEEINTVNFMADTNFKKNEEYSSLTGMSIIAMVDEKYNVPLTGNELRGVNTIEELYILVHSKRIS